MLEKLVPGIWTVGSPLKLFGAEVGTKMTVVRLAEGGLLLISPIEIDDALASALEQIGPVRAVIAPNAFHHLFVRAALARYPDAKCFLAEGVEKKMGSRPDGAVDLSIVPDPLWASDLSQVVLEGSPMTNEVVFFHEATRTMILTDLCFNFDDSSRGWTKLFLWLDGGYDQLAVSRVLRWALRPKEKARASIAAMLKWEVENIVVAHGDNILGGGGVRFEEAMRDV